MADYSYVPKVADEAAVYTSGLVLMGKDGIGDYKVGYVADTANDIRVGLYQSGTNLFMVFASNSALSDLHIYLVNSASTTLFDLTSISTPYESGYWTEDSYYIVPDTTASTVFSTRSELLAKMIDSSPSTDSGVVVTVNASPIDTPVSSDGVIVTVVAKLLDPNDESGTSEPGGGQGTHDESSDVVPVPALPTVSAANSGLVTLFRPDLSQLHDLGEYLWTNITDFIENLQKLFSNPMDYFIAFHIVPCIPDVGTSRKIKLGLWETNVEMPPVTSQWYEHNCGTVSLPEFWGSALDYAPNTKVSLFLPFIGSVQLNTDEIMGKQIGLIYRIDLLSGQCVAMVTVNVLNGQAPSVLYQYTGECGVSVPLTGADWSRVYAAGIGAVGTAITGGISAAASGVAAGGATAALASSKAAEAVGSVGQSYAAINAVSKGVKGVKAMRDTMQEAASMALQTARDAANIPTQVGAGVRASRIANTVNNTIGAVMSGKMSVAHSGSISGSAGLLGNRTPYLMVEYPNQSLAEGYKHFTGYPSNIRSTLKSLNGYTECEQVIPSNVSGATDGEIAEILETLKGGVYLNFSNATTKGTGITLYNYTTSPNTVGKGAQVVDTYQGTFRDPVSITEPTFTIERSSPIGFNYVYIAAFDRFYYVKGVSADLHGIVTISCTVDPLETYAVAISNFDAIIRRQENQFNLYLDDGIFKAYQNTKHKLIAFPNAFNDNSYVLAIAGNSDS